ncbi:MAG: MGMT family protein [Clostridia bacterium]|nr:MGMT family protein [Clostridia bacterium]
MIEHGSGFFERVYDVVKNIPEGKVLTYGDVARAVGAPRCARQVGWALHCNPQPGVIPCHRVVFSDGGLSKGFAFGGPEVQKALLEREGVAVSENFTVDLKKYRWNVFK